MDACSVAALASLVAWMLCGVVGYWERRLAAEMVVGAAGAPAEG